MASMQWLADHERSTGPSEIEWIVLPEGFCLRAETAEITKPITPAQFAAMGEPAAHLGPSGATGRKSTTFDTILSIDKM